MISTDQNDKSDFVSVRVSVEDFGVIRKVSAKAVSSRLFGDVPIPYIFIFLLSAIISGVLFNFLVLKRLKIASAWSIIFGLIVGVIVILIF